MNTKVFESPDNGVNVFERMTGSLVQHPVNTSSPDYLARWHEFRDILRMAETNVTLNDALSQVEMLYTLIADGKK